MVHTGWGPCTATATQCQLCTLRPARQSAAVLQQHAKVTSRRALASFMSCRQTVPCSNIARAPASKSEANARCPKEDTASNVPGNATKTASYAPTCCLQSIHSRESAKKDGRPCVAYTNLFALHAATGAAWVSFCCELFWMWWATYALNHCATTQNFAEHLSPS